MPTLIQIDDNADATSSISLILLDDAVKILIQNGTLDKDKLADAIVKAKDDWLTLNKNNGDNLLKMQIFMIAHTLQCHYCQLT